MNKTNIMAAVDEARRFLDRAEAWAGTLTETTYMEGTEHEMTLEESGTKERGALRRASLDLTRALAAMRKG